MSDRPARLRQLLAGLVDGKRVLGAAVVGRDGFPVQSQLAGPVSEETFSAMAAAMLGAAEAAVQEWSDERPWRAAAEGPHLRLGVEALDNDFLFVVVTPVTEPAGAPDVAKAVTDLKAILKG